MLNAGYIIPSIPMVPICTHVLAQKKEQTKTDFTNYRGAPILERNIHLIPTQNEFEKYI